MSGSVSFIFFMSLASFVMGVAYTIMPVFMKKHLKINDNSSINIKIGIWNMETETIINDEKETTTTENDCNDIDDQSSGNGVDDQSFSNDCKDVLRTKCKLSKAFSIIGAIAGGIACWISVLFSLLKDFIFIKNTYSAIIILVISIVVSFISHLIIMIIFISYKVEKDNKNDCSIDTDFDLDFGASFILCCFCLAVTLIAILYFIIYYKSIKEAL